MKGTDTLNIIQFNSITPNLFAEPRRADADSIPAALKYVDALSANGGTEMHPALSLAFAQRHDPSRVRQIVFLTDGAVGNEEQWFGLMRERPGEWRRSWLASVARRTVFSCAGRRKFGRGTFTYIGKAGRNANANG